MGFNMIKELETASIKNILLERRNGQFQNLEDFVSRCKISIEQLSLLIRIHAFRFTKKPKQYLLWDMYRLLGNSKKTQAEQSLFQVYRPNYNIPTLDEHRYEDAYDEMDLLGFPLCSPFDILQDELPSKLKAVEIEKYLGRQISIVGYLVTIKNTRTSQKTLMQFGTFIDYEGNWIDTVHFPPSVARFPFRGRGCYLLKGKVVEEFNYHTIEVNYMERLDYVNRDENNIPQKRPSKTKKA